MFQVYSLLLVTILLLNPTTAITTFQTSATTAATLHDSEGRVLLESSMVKKITQFCADVKVVVAQNPTDWCPSVQSMYTGLLQNTNGVMTTNNLFFSKFENSMLSNGCPLR